MQTHFFQSSTVLPTTKNDYTDDQIVQMFLAVRSRSPHTYKSYQRAIRRFQRFIAGRRLGDVTWQEIEMYKLHLIKGASSHTNNFAPLLPASIAAAIAPLKSLYKWGSDPDIGLFVSNPTRNIVLPQIPISSRHHFLTQLETGRLLRYLQRQSDPRNYLIALSLIVLGLRVSELCSIRMSDFYTISEDKVICLNVAKGKGGRSREIKVPLYLWELLRTYVHKYGQKRIGDDDRLFPISPRQIERIIKHASDKCGLHKKVTPHWLRHTSATIALMNGATLQQVQETLGHAHLNTTQRYLHTVEQLKKAPSDFIQDAILPYI